MEVSIQWRIKECPLPYMSMVNRLFPGLEMEADEFYRIPQKDPYFIFAVRLYMLLQGLSLQL